MDRMPIDHVYFLKLTQNNNVKPHIKAGDTFREAKPADFDWKAKDSVCFEPDDGFNVLVAFVVQTSPGVFVVDPQPPLGVQKVTDASIRKVPIQAHQGGKVFRFHCSLIDSKTQKVFGWETTKDDAASGSPDANVHN